MAILAIWFTWSQRLLKLFCIPIFWLWVYRMKVIPFQYFDWVHRMKVIPFQYFDYECTEWRLFHSNILTMSEWRLFHSNILTMSEWRLFQIKTSVVCTKLGIYVFGIFSIANRSDADFSTTKHLLPLTLF